MFIEFEHLLMRCLEMRISLLIFNLEQNMPSQNHIPLLAVTDYIIGMRKDIEISQISKNPIINEQLMRVHIFNSVSKLPMD